jgi:ArsR family transcriptional regulator
LAKTTDSIVFIDVSTFKMQKAILLMRAITHPLRLKLLSYIDKNEEVNVNKIYTALNLEQSVTSQHLRILRSAGYVSTKRKGKYIFYHVNYELIQKLLLLADKYKVK